MNAFQLRNLPLASFQVRKIAAVFKLQPASLYLVKEFENVVVFPHEQSGRFNRTQVDSSYTYEVHGDEVSDPGTPSHAVVSKPFSAYTGPSYHSASSPSLSVSTPRQPTPFSAAGRRKSTFRKTIALVSLTADTEALPVEVIRPGELTSSPGSLLPPEMNA